MDKKVGVYVCSGCGIGECLDTEKLTGLGEKDYSAAAVRTSPAFCLEDAQQIRDDISAGAVDSVVIAACSPRVNTDVFAFSPAVVERVNLREQVAWSHPPREAETQSMAEDYLRMGITRAQLAKAPTPFVEANERTVLVVGGGVAGLSAAAHAAATGYKVVLVEKTSRLGGYAANLYKQFPKRAPFRELEPVNVAALVAEVKSNRNIRVFTGAHLEQLSGQPGRFAATIQHGGGAETITVGATVLATGWKPTEPGKFARYGLGKFANVITSDRLEQMAAKRELARPTDAKPIGHAAVVLCDGPGDDEHPPYEGNVASLVALKQALYIRERFPDSVVYLFYRDMHATGQYEYFYRRVQEDEGILFSRGEITDVTEDGEGRVVLEVANTVLGGSIETPVDLLVVATDMVPASHNAGGALNLEYLQGSEPPITSLGYTSSNFICFPYETRRTGIYSAGAVRQAMDTAAAEDDGAAGALKAIQCIEKSSAGAAVHPRVGDLTYPKFFMQKCTSCGRCSQECPFGALEVDDKNHPVIDPNRCRRCGICMGACPVQVISFDDYSVEMLAAMMKAVEIPEDDDTKPRILVLACENDAYPAIDMAGIARHNYAASVRVIPVRCLGSINSILIADAMSRGYDAVALMGCKSGEDYQCHFIRGSELLAKRMENVQETLDRLALESERVQYMEVAISEADRIPGLFANVVDVVGRVGLNPMKGF